MKMKLIIILAALTLSQAGKLDRAYLPPNARASVVASNFLQTPNSFSRRGPTQNINGYSSGTISNQNTYDQYSGLESRPERAQAAIERNAAILRQDSSNDGETYSYAYETENGIYAEESGVATNGVQAQGEYTYTGDDGKVYSVRYTADENGFVPQGDHLPTPPPIPEEILRSLELNAREEAAGIYDDGSYVEAKYAGNNQQQYYNTNAQSVNYDKRIDVVQKNYLPPSTQRNNYNTRTSTVQKTYLPPSAQRNNYNRRTSTVQKTYLPPSAQRNNYNRRTSTVQKTYLPPSAQRNNYQRNGY